MFEKWLKDHKQRIMIHNAGYQQCPVDKKKKEKVMINSTILSCEEVGCRDQCYRGHGEKSNIQRFGFDSGHQVRLQFALQYNNKALVAIPVHCK